MKRILTVFFLLLLLASCRVKQTQNYLNSGDYDSAIDNATYALRNNKDKKGKQDYVYMLEEAYAKAKARDEQEIKILVKENTPRNLEQLFNLYVQMHNRQEKVRALLPLKLLEENREAQFQFDDYSSEIASSKTSLSAYLYENSIALLLSNHKESARRAYEDLVYLNQITPGYKDVTVQIQRAKQLGSDYVQVIAKNDTPLIIPIQLERNLLDMDTYGLNDSWTVYHSVPQNIRYDYAVELNFREILISPERVDSKREIFEKDIKVGQQKKTVRGRVVKDSLGRPVMEDVFKKVRCEVSDFMQFKSVLVTAKVNYIDLKSNQLLQTFPLTSEFIFQHQYARYKGDTRAVPQEYHPLFRQIPMAFPSNEQMVLDTGEDLKSKLKTILSRNRIRN